MRMLSTISPGILSSTTASASSSGSALRGLGLAALLAPLLAACASAVPSAGGGRPIKTIAGQPVRPPVRATPRDPNFQTIPGLEGVVGVGEDQLVRQFGPARLNVWEGDARKLQFIGKACVLDVFLYPTAQSKTPLASYVDARRSSDGKDVDRAACVAALKAR